MHSTRSNLTLQHNWQFEAIGTLWQIDTDRPISESTRHKITTYIEKFDAEYSRFRDDSTVGEMARHAGDYTFSSGSKKLLDFYKQLYNVTDGAVTPMAGDALVALGYDMQYSFIPKERPSIPDWDTVMKWEGVTARVTQPVVFDVGAAGKGFLIDQVGIILNDSAYTRYIIDGSGDILHHGTVEQAIGLEDPRDPTRVIGVASVTNKSICASATNRRQWGQDLHHIIDARSGQPTKEIIATWVVADSAMIADGLATTLFFCEPTVLREIADFQYVRMNDQGIVEYSRGFVGELFI